MIRYYEDHNDSYADISGKRAEIVQADRTGIVAECQLNDLKDEDGVGFSENLSLYLQSEDGFGTNLFYTLFIYNLGTELSLVFLSCLDDEKVDDDINYARLIDSIPNKNPHKDGLEINGLVISNSPCELAVVKKISLTENIYDSIRETAFKINKLFCLKSQWELMGVIFWRPTVLLKNYIQSKEKQNEN